MSGGFVSFFILLTGTSVTLSSTSWIQKGLINVTLGYTLDITYGYNNGPSDQVSQVIKVRFKRYCH